MEGQFVMCSIRKLYVFLYIICVSSISFTLIARELLIGDPEAGSDQTFSFPISAHQTGYGLYVGAGNQKGDLFSISRLDMASNKFKGITPEVVTLDGSDGQFNPLFNAQILFLSLLRDGRVAAVTALESSRVYYVTISQRSQVAMLASSALIDANFGVSNGIVGMKSIGPESTIVVVRGNGQANFGDGESGLAFLVSRFAVEPGVIRAKEVLSQLNATNGELQNPQAILLNKSSDVITIGANLAAVEDVVDLHWSNTLKTMYVGLEVTSANGAADGARSVVAVQFVGGKIVMRSIVPNDALDASEDKIIGVKGASKSLFTHMVRTLQTPTVHESARGLDYLLLLGGNGSLGNTRRTVFALPVVNTRTAFGEIQDSATQGTLANVLQEPKDLFRRAKFIKEEIDLIFYGRQFTEPATSPTELFTTTSRAACVGGGPISVGDVVDMFIRNDTVFVVVKEADFGKKPGIFYSQALLNTRNVIVGWTEWQRTAGTVESLTAATRSLQTGNFVTIRNQGAGTAVEKTVWSSGCPNGLKQLSNLLSESLSSTQGGLQGLFNFSQKASALTDISCLVATGLRKVIIIEGGRSINGTFCPNSGSIFADQKKIFDSGAVTENLILNGSTRYIEFSGGNIQELGAITSAALAQDTTGNNGWLFVGGVDGLAVLSNNNGTGWTPLNSELGPGFFGLTQGMSFRKIGDYAHVRKIISDRGFLYVLTDTRLDRIELLANNIALSNPEVVTIATAQENTGESLVDCIVSEKLLLLSTSVRLVRIGNGKDATLISNTSDAHWTPIFLPAGVTPVSTLFAVSVSGKMEDVSRNGGGMIYVVDSYLGKNRARLHRLEIQDTTVTAVGDDTVTVFLDLYFEKTNSYFRNYGTARTKFNTDGSFFVSSRNKNITEPPQLIANFVPLRLLPLNIEFASQLTSIVQNSALGNLLVAGDFVLRVNE